MSDLTMKGKQQIEHFKRLFPDLIKDWHGWSYSVNRNRDGIVISRTLERSAPAYIFVYRSETDWELRCGKESRYGGQS